MPMDYRSILGSVYGLQVTFWGLSMDVRSWLPVKFWGLSIVYGLQVDFGACLWLTGHFLGSAYGLQVKF